MALRNLFRRTAPPSDVGKPPPGEGVAKTTETEATLNGQLTEMARAAMSAADRWLPIYADGRDYLFCNQLAGQKRKEGWPRIQVNQLYPAAMQEISALAQRRVVPRTSPQNPNQEVDRKMADAWGPKLFHWYVDEAKMPRVLLNCMLDGKTNGHWVVKYAWDPHWQWDERAQEGRGAWIGSVRPMLLKAQFVGFDPEAESFEDAAYVVIRYEKSVAEAIAQWPAKKDEILKAARHEMEGARSYGASDSQTVTTSNNIVPQKDQYDADGGEGRLSWLLSDEPNRSDLADLPGKSGKRDQRDGRPVNVTVEEFWYRDDESKKRPAVMADTPPEQLLASGEFTQDVDGSLVDAEGQPVDSERWPQTEQYPADEVPLYPHGRHIVRVGQDTILNPEKAQQVWKYAFWPSVWGVNTPLPHTPHGMNAVEHGRYQQDWINRAWAHIGNGIDQFGDPQIVVEPEMVWGYSGKGPLAKHIKARAGGIVKMHKGGISAYRREPAPPLDMGHLAFVAKQEENLQDSTGSHSVSLGRQEKGATTATEVATTSAQSQFRTALMSIMLDEFIIRSLYVVADIFQREYAKGGMQAEQMMRVRGNGGDNLDVPGELPYDPQMAVTPFEITIETTSAIPYDRQRAKLEATELYGIFPTLNAAKNVLDAYEVKNKEEWLAEIATPELPSGGSSGGGSTKTGGAEPFQPGKVAGSRGQPGPSSK